VAEATGTASLRWLKTRLGTLARTLPASTRSAFRQETSACNIDKRSLANCAAFLKGIRAASQEGNSREGSYSTWRLVRHVMPMHRRSTRPLVLRGWPWGARGQGLMTRRPSILRQARDDGSADGRIGMGRVPAAMRASGHEDARAAGLRAARRLS